MFNPRIIVNTRQSMVGSHMKNTPEGVIFPEVETSTYITDSKREPHRTNEMRTRRKPPISLSARSSGNDFNRRLMGRVSATLVLLTFVQWSRAESPGTTTFPTTTAASIKLVAPLFID
ncbi:unnamed protein product [Allacma fusca]|uniref:Uncharacterized protein n=1 Tax=Allacma fusca TaxID=39272 RepID=A0A8J2K0P5_9HEXA|nr:unnamed protein product [Allacma fusca]